MTEQRPGRDRSARSPRRRRPTWVGSLGFWCALVIIILLLAYAQVLEASRPHVDGDRLRLDSFVSLAEQDRIRNVEILDQDSYLVGEYVSRDGAVRRYNMPFLKAQNTRDRLADVVIDQRIRSRVNQQFAKSLVVPATALLPVLMLIVAFVYFVMSYRQGTGPFGGIRSGARKVERGDEGHVTFADVAGQESAVAELREVSDYLAHPEQFAGLGAQVPRGVLLYGPPGCGKTLMARALAGEAGASFYSISGADFVELYVGVGAARVRDLFSEARENAPAIVFIDELDSIGRQRGVGSPGGGSAGRDESAGSQEYNQALTQLLSEIDGFSTTEGVIIVAATNRPDVLDPALLRPGRFDRTIPLELPDEADRLEILQLHARSRNLEPDVELEEIARKAIGMTGADLAGVMNEAALRAGRARKSAISHQDLKDALERISEAPERQRRLSIRERGPGQGLLQRERATFADVAGLDDAVQELGEVREYLADPARFERLGARLPSGYLLAGPPGCGKTLLARAVAGEANAAFVSTAATEFVELYVGQGAARVRNLFADARSAAPAILFIDELDAIGARRGWMLDHGERAQTLNQLLVELDGVRGRSGIVVIAATNRPDVLDEALVRPGRFDRKLELDLPDLKARRAIIDVHAQGKRLGTDVDLDALARLTRGMAGADLAGLMNEAALLGARRNEDALSMSLLEEALDRIGSGIAGRRDLSEDERRRVAYHEAGHGLVARSLPGGRVLHKLTIVGRGRYLGTTWLPEDADRMVHSRSLLIERMATLLGGKVAEEIVYGESGDGTSSDLSRVGAIARNMVAALGMSESVGAINFTVLEQNGNRGYSEATARLIDEASRDLAREAEQLAHSVLVEQRAELERVVEALLERETLTLEEVEEIAGPAPARATGNGRGSTS